MYYTILYSTAPYCIALYAAPQNDTECTMLPVLYQVAALLSGERELPTGRMLAMLGAADQYEHVSASPPTTLRTPSLVHHAGPHHTEQSDTRSA
eukprot:5641764-Pyramimonas_sp.AAC.1